MASADDALAAFKTLRAKLEESLSKLKTPTGQKARPNEDPRTCLVPVGEAFAHDAAKLAMMYSDKPPSADDSVGLAQYVQKDTDQFVAWCNAVQNESAVMNREVEQVASSMLNGMKSIVHLLIENKLKKAPGSQMVGEVMAGQEKLKKLSKNEAQGVQKEVLRDAAAVKTVLSDVKEMLENAATHAMEDMSLGGGEGAKRQETDYDLLQMDIALGPEESKIVEACVVIIEACMAVLKSAVRVIAAKPAGEEAPAGEGGLPYEEIARASKAFTRAAEDLGALSCLDQAQCRPTAQVLVQGLEQACAAVAAVAAAKADVGEHVTNAQEALGRAKQAVPAL